MGEVAHVDGTDIQIVAYVLVTEGSEGCPELEVVDRTAYVVEERFFGNTPTH